PEAIACDADAIVASMAEAIESRRPLGCDYPISAVVADLLAFAPPAADDAANVQLTPGDGPAERRFGGRTEANRAALLKAHGGNDASEKAVDAGLEWLAHQQQPDGRWSLKG